ASRTLPQPLAGSQHRNGCFRAVPPTSTPRGSTSMPGAVVKAAHIHAQRARLHARRTRWRPSHRTVPSRFPPVGLFVRVAAPEDLEAVFALEAMTNDRLREEAGELPLVAKEDRISGPGTTPIMAAFTHLNPEGSRFSDGS